MRRPTLYRTLLFCLPLAGLAGYASAASPAIPAEINDKPGTYHFLEHATKRWRLCAVLPQAQDHFFWAVAWGIASQAKAAGADVGIYQAGGYDNLAVQKKQVLQCAADGADAVLIAAADPDGFKEELTQLHAHGIKVIDLLNGLHGDTVAAHAYENLTLGADAIAHRLRKLAGDTPFHIAWFPGPLHASWAAEYDTALRKALAADPRFGKTLFLDDGGAGPTEQTAQATLVRDYAAVHRPDAIVGNAVAADFAVRFYQGKPNAPKYILATYTNESVVADLKAGKLDAMLSVEPVTEARIAVDLALRALENQPLPRRVGVATRLITADNLATYLADDPTQTSVSPAGVRMPLPQLPPLIK